ncbi:kinetochore-associated protein NSL1 homolog isoform X1 [Centrocercus urophasianus]|uniref:kinetochore-associated protein NSL1 homolog isoform X1 n=1 Tax=Centrocercus urophasianus TaxID=9002 RepID=UPI001C64EB79|nr:kinetochore-associated protein NSL1 homolog isoform X1 [Centrocercus urophasianus]
MPPRRARPRPREGRGGGVAGCASGPAFSVRRRREMAAGPSERRDARVRCCSRRGLDEVVGLCAPFLRGLAQGQPGGSAAADDAIWNFEAAVRENVTINGQLWAETSADSEPSSANIKILEDQLDELIVETATKRKQWPKKILVHAIQTMKAEQEMLKLYQPVITPEEIKSQPSQDAYLADLKQVTEMASEQIGEAMKSLPALIERAEGFSQALTWQPTLELCKLRQEVFTGCNAKEENSVQNFVSPAEVTPTDADTTNNPYTLFKRKKAADTPQRRYYPLRRRKITLSM